MSHRWAALVLVLALCAFAPKNAAGQSQPPRGHKSGGLGQNYPNPFNPETRIPFTVGDIEASCTGDTQLHVVSMQVINALGQVVTVPVFESTACVSIAAVANGTPIRNLRLPCGKYVAFWDGNYQGTTKEVASGIYVVRLVIDQDKPLSRRMFVRK